MYLDDQFISWLRALDRMGGSDLYLTVGAPPTVRADAIERLGDAPLAETRVQTILDSLLNIQQRETFDQTNEFNMSLVRPGIGRFRINIFRQRQMPGFVIRRITTEIPRLEDLQLPEILADLVMERRGLILVVGGTGSGKSTTLAAMVGHRNRHVAGHIVTIEDPVEFIHEHRACVITQREVGVDTPSYHSALKNALRQKPDVILIGEVRDREVMEHALNISETGHLCLATLHANNANQAVDRILSFFPSDMKAQVLLGLSMNLRAVVSQRLVPTVDGKRTAAMEIMLNQGLIRELIRSGEVKEMKAVMADNRPSGMQTFDQALSDLVQEGRIEEATALAEADNPTDLRLRIQQTRLAGTQGGFAAVDTSRLSL